MSDKSNNQGRAYEFAWINVLFNELSKIRSVEIFKNSSYYANEKAWASIDVATQELYEVSANAAVQAIIEMEPLMVDGSDDTLLLIPQKDGNGTKGDVRDLLISRNDITWEVGLSIKHNHEAIKHSRLSHALDFGQEWFGSACSPNYWADIKPVFNMLKAEKTKGTKFSQLADKDHDVYIPLLNAFIDEVNRKYAEDNSIARKMIEYLIGVTDYYKVISCDSKRLTLIRTFNIHGTLNKPSKIKVSAITVPIVNLPTRIVALQRKPGTNTTAEMYLDNGWQISFRIHNAEDKIVPSLKFDIQFIGMPTEIFPIECKWNIHTKN